MSMTHEEVRAAADAIMPPDEEYKEAMRCLRVVRAMERSVEVFTHDAGAFYAAKAVRGDWMIVTLNAGRDRPPTFLAALEAVVGIEVSE